MTREVAIDNLKADIKYWENTSVSTEHLCMAIKSLEQEPRWISVNERMPEANKAVLTYVDTGMTKTYCLADWNGNCIGWEEWIGTRQIEKEMGYKVLAWMPLPKSYKEK